MPEPVQLVRAGSPLWAEYMNPMEHDFYFREPYHEFMQTQGYGEPWLAVAGSRDRFLAWPFLLRSLNPTFTLRDGLGDITSVYGYAGPLAFGCKPGDPFLLTAWESLIARWRAGGVVSVFCRFHPLLQNHRWVEEASVSPSASVPFELAAEGHTVSLDLTRAGAEAWAEYRETHRRHMNRARRFGLICEVDDDFAHLGEFVKLYHATMRRNFAAAEYFYDAAAFELLVRKLKPAVFLHIARAGTRVAAAAMVSEFQGIVQYLYGAADEQFFEISPLKLLLESVRKWSRSRGNRIMHLGGGRGGREDSLFYFKSGFSDRRHPFFTGRCVLNVDLYHSLREEHIRAARKCGKAVDSHFFPAYRAPFTEVEPSQSLVSSGMM